MPFDDDYKPCFEALIFTIMAGGYRVRCALEENDAGQVRYVKLCRLIADCNRSVHDLSRIELTAGGLPRFNMPFELGLFQGAHRFGSKSHRAKTALILVRDRFKLPVYMSDVAGNDPEAHHGEPEEVIRAVRRYLHIRPDGSQMPGAAFMVSTFVRFQAALPRLAAALHIRPDELDCLRDYKDHVALLAEFLRQD